MRQIGGGTPPTGLTGIYLKTDPGQGFTPSDRIVGDAGNFRTVGPVLAATSGDRTFKRVRIPLRSFAADSSAIGKTLVLGIINAATGVVVGRRTLTITAGMTEAVFEGPFVIPAGQQHGYVYGVEEGDWDSYLYLFYGNGSPYGAPNSSVASLYSDSVTPQVGQGWGAPSQTGKHRAILCEADGVTKNVRGPLDPSDFPVVTSLDQLLPGQAALLDNGTDPPRLVRRRLDGSVPAFVNAVSEWPMLIASLGGEDGNQVAQHVDGPAFQRILLTPTVDTHNGWDAQNHRYLAPETGLYRIEMKMRVKDGGLPQGVSIGLGALDPGPSFLWSVSNANREGLMNQRVMALNKGDEVYLMCYIDRSGGADLAAAEMTIDRIR